MTGDYPATKSDDYDDDDDDDDDEMMMMMMICHDENTWISNLEAYFSYFI